VAGHPAERLVRESLFFLVWSCPQSVSAAVMCELAGLEFQETTPDTHRPSQRRGR